MSDPDDRVTILIADDEPILAMDLAVRVKRLWESTEILPLCHNGEATMEIILAEQPEVAFLDINMPGLTGIQIGERLKQEGSRTRVVYVTAYDQHAVQAFEQQAIDYLLKPVTDERLLQALERLKQFLAFSALTQNPPASEIKSETSPEVVKAPLTHLIARIGERKKVIALGDICCLQADGKYTRVISAEGEYLLSESLKALEEQLPSDGFWRIHRSTLVNPDYIQETRRTDTGRLSLSLKGHSETLIVSRRYLSRFRQESG